MDTNSEAWRLECEVRHIASMTKDQRADWFKAIKKHRGEAAANVLIEQVNAYRRNLPGRAASPGSRVAS